MNIIDVLGKEKFEEILETNKDKLVVVDFWAPWCGPCKALAPTLENLSVDFGDKIQIVKVNVDENANQDLNQQFEVRSIPAIFFIKNKEVVQSFAGALQYNQFKKDIEANL